MSAIDEAKAYLRQLAPHARDRRAAELIRAMIAERDATCTWVYGAASRYWLTDCGESFAIHEGSPGQNGLRYCCFCGRQLREA